MPTEVDRVKFSVSEYRNVINEDLAVQTAHPLSSELIYVTLIASSTDASLFGASILTLRKEDRNTWQCLVVSENYLTLELGDTITVVYPRFGFSGGKNFIVKKIKRDSNSQFLELSLFGPQ